MHEPTTAGSITARLASLGRFAALALALGLSSTSADAALARTGEAEAAFRATGTGGMTINGKTGDLQIGEDGASVVVTVPLATLQTGLALRDRHMRDKYLETSKYPNAVLRVDRSALGFPDDGASITKTVPGRLTLHGQTRPVNLRYTANRSGDRYSVAGAMGVNMTDHGIDPPSFMGVKVNPQVTVTVRFQARNAP